MTLSCCKTFVIITKGITSNHNGEFYCLNCFQSYRTENELKKHEKVCNGHDYCYVEMPDESNKILKTTTEKSHWKLQLLLMLS